MKFNAGNTLIGDGLSSTPQHNLFTYSDVQYDPKNKNRIDGQTDH